MRQAFILFLIFLGLLSSSIVDAQIDTQALNNLFTFYNFGGTPGVSVVIVKDGETLFQNAYGVADIKNSVPATTDTAFHLASVGKQMTALAVLMLSAEGALSLDDSIVKYLPQLKPWAAKVKIRNLLYHTSGIPDYYDEIEESYRRPSNSQAIRYLAHLGRLDFQPGKRFKYSNSGYDTLGALVEKVSGQRFGDFMQQRIFTPAQMNNSFAFDKARRKASKHALGYAPVRRGYVLDDTSALNDLHGSGSIYSTVEDLAKYDSALFGYKFVSKEILEQAFASGKLNNGRVLNYGFGWDLLVDPDLNLPYYGHSGEWMGFSAYYLHYPSLKLSIIVLSNCSCTDAETLAFRAAQIAAR